MKILTNIFAFTLLAAGTLSCATVYQEDTELLINRMLHIDNDKYMTKLETGEDYYNSLLEYKDWEKLYIKYSKYDSADKSLTEKEAKILLFMAFIARTSSDASMSESFSSDLVPIYNANKDMILKILATHEFMISPTCYYLNNYFGFEGKNTDSKPEFIRTNKKIMTDVIGKDKTALCLD